MFELAGVEHRYRRGDAAALGLGGLDLRLGGGVVAVLGQSGSGKSSLLSLLGLLLDGPPSAGRICYLGRGTPIEYGPNLSAAARGALRRDEFGFVLQSAYLLGHLSLAENVAVPLELRGLGHEAIRERTDRLLKAANLGDRGDRKARTLSGGERQRGAALRAVAHDPRVIFADEPVSSLDGASAEALWGVLDAWRAGDWQLPGRANPGRTMILVTHVVPDALARAETFLILHRGKCVGGRMFARAEVDAELLEHAIRHGAIGR